MKSLSIVNHSRSLFLLFPAKISVLCSPRARVVPSCSWSERRNLRACFYFLFFIFLFSVFLIKDLCSFIVFIDKEIN